MAALDDTLLKTGPQNRFGAILFATSLWLTLQAILRLFTKLWEQVLNIMRSIMACKARYKEVPSKTRSVLFCEQPQTDPQRGGDQGWIA